MPLKANGASHLSVKESPKEKRDNFIKKQKDIIAKKAKIYTYLKRVKRDLED